MKINISKHEEFYHAIVETKKGRRYLAVYSHVITHDEVSEDFKLRRSSFHHINGQ